MPAYLSFPKKSTIRAFIKTEAPRPYNYQNVGASNGQQVEGFDNDHNKIFLGKGDVIWENAKAVLKNWQQFPDKWTKVVPNDTPLKENETVAVFFKLFGIWWLNSARIVYTLDDERRFGFAYGTLPAHVERGEECFWIEKEVDGRIFYHIRAFSKPRLWLVKLGYPIARTYQRKFVRQSMETMKRLANQNMPTHA